MAALAIPVVEAVGVRLLTALGVGAAAGELAREAARKRADAAGQAKAAPVARTEATTRTREKCRKCPPEQGAPFNRSTAGWSEMSVLYQHRICGLPVGPGFITEWLFNAVTFDGFNAGQCLLKEAKARYDQFFDDFGFRRDFWNGDEAMLAQAVTQSAIALPRPPIQLRWYFMEPKSFRYFSKIFSSAKLQIETVFMP